MAEIDLILTVAKLADELSGRGSSFGSGLNRLAAQVSNGFKARKEEVAILHLSADAKVLSFIFPIKLSYVGAIPISTTHPLAAKNHPREAW